MSTLALLLLASAGFAGPYREPPRLKSPEELRALCDKMQSEANRVIAPVPPGSCGSFLGGSLAASREELKKEFEGDRGVVHYCRELEGKLRELWRYRAGVQSACQAAGTSAALASANTKSRKQEALLADVASSREKIAAQQASCAGAIAPIVPASSPNYRIQPGMVREPAPANPPKDTYPKLGKDVVHRQTQFIDRTARNGGAAAYEDEKDSCGTIARAYINLAKATRVHFDQMSDLVAAERDRAVGELESYRNAAAKFSGSAAGVRQTVEQLSAPLPPTPKYDQSDD